MASRHASVVRLAAAHDARVADAPHHESRRRHRDGLEHHLEDRVVRGRRDLEVERQVVARRAARSCSRRRAPAPSRSRPGPTSVARSAAYRAALVSSRRRASDSWCAVTPRRRMAMPPCRCDPDRRPPDERAARRDRLDEAHLGQRAQRFPDERPPHAELLASSRSEGSFAPAARRPERCPRRSSGRRYRRSVRTRSLSPPRFDSAASVAGLAGLTGITGGGYTDRSTQERPLRRADSSRGSDRHAGAAMIGVRRRAAE